MRWLLILARLAFICNVFFLLALSLQAFRWIKNGDAEATVIILGYVMVLVLNPLVNILCGILFLTGNPKFAVVPRWLIVANGFFLLLQIMYIIFLNDR